MINLLLRGGKLEISLLFLNFLYYFVLEANNYLKNRGKTLTLYIFYLPTFILIYLSYILKEKKSYGNIKGTSINKKAWIIFSSKSSKEINTLIIIVHRFIDLLSISTKKTRSEHSIYCIVGVALNFRMNHNHIPHTKKGIVSSLPFKRERIKIHDKILLKHKD